MNISFIYGFSFNYFKSLSFKESECLFPGILKIKSGPVSVCGTDKIEGDKSHISFCGYLIVKLSYRTAAEISGILILVLIICDFPVDLLKIGITYNSFSPENK